MNAINCKPNMKSVGNVTHAGVQYPPGTEFYVADQHHVDYLVKSGRAVELQPTPEARDEPSKETSEKGSGQADEVPAVRVSRPTDRKSRGR